MSPMILPAASFSGKVSTSVGRSWPLWRALRRRMASGPTKVTEMSASRRSPSSTASTARFTSARGSGSPRPLTTTSLTLDGLEFRRDSTAEARIADPLVVGPGHHPGKFPLDPVEVAQGKRCVIELTRAELLLDQVLDRVAHRFRRRVAQHPDGGLGRVGQHGHG